MLVAGRLNLVRGRPLRPLADPGRGLGLGGPARLSRSGGGCRSRRAGLGAAALAVAVNLLAAGGIGISGGRAGALVLLALGLNLRDDRACGRLRDAGGRLPAFALAAVWAALLGTFAGAVVPFWESEAAIAEAEAALARRPPDFDTRRGRLRPGDPRRPVQRPALARPGLPRIRDLARARGAKPDDLRWKKIPVLLLKAVTPPRNPKSWTLHRDRALVTRDLLAQLGAKPDPRRAAPPPRQHRRGHADGLAALPDERRACTPGSPRPAPRSA